MRTPLIIAVAAMATLLPGSGRAAGLAPKKPSELVTIRGFANPCPTIGVGNAIDMQTNPDGTSSAFTIPAGKVFIITSARLGAVGTPANGADLQLRRVTPSANNVIDVRQGDVEPTSSRYNVELEFPTGVVVKAGTTLCVVGTDLVTSADLNVSAWVQGYLATDR